MARSDDNPFALAVIAGSVDPADPSVAARLIVLRAKHAGRGDATMIGLISRAFAALACATDRAYLESLIDGSGDLLAEDTFTRLEPLFTKYEEGSEMYVLLERAATAYADRAVEMANFVLAEIEMKEIIERARYGGDWQ